MLGYVMIWFAWVRSGLMGCATADTVCQGWLGVAKVVLDSLRQISCATCRSATVRSVVSRFVLAVEVSCDLASKAQASCGLADMFGLVLFW